MSPNAADKELSDHLIDKYRELVSYRYNYESMSERFALPPGLTPEVIESVRDFFLNSIYPDVDERHRLDEAFQTLGSFISKPSKIWRLLGSMTTAIFKFGRLFPAALKAGYKSLQSYLDAKKFEQSLLVAARHHGFTKPLSRENFDRCLATIPRAEAEDFMKTVLSLFTSLTNDSLLEKTMLIMQNVIQRMEQYPNVYTPGEIDGIRLGVSVLENGYAVMHRLPEKTKKQIVEYIEKNELWFLDEVYQYA